MEMLETRKKKAERIIFWFSILTLGSGYILYLSLRLMFSELAKKNTLVAFRTDGEIKAIMRGNECITYLMKVENYRFDPDGFDLFKGSFESYAALLVKAAEKRRQEDPAFVERKLKLDKKTNKPIQINGQYQLTDDLKKHIIEANSSTLFEELFGVFWFGIAPYRVFEYKFRWLKYGQEKAKDGIPSEKVGIHPREEEVDSLFFRYPQYGIVIDNAETGAGSLAVSTDKGVTIAKIQVKATVVFETITTNPQKTLFRTAALSSAGDWQQALVREIKDRIRVWLGSTNWDDLVENKESFIEKKLQEIKDGINGLDKEGLPLLEPQIGAIRDYGQMLVKISMPHLDLEDTELQKAAENVFKAERGRDADIAKAAGNRALAAAPVLGKADGLEKIANIPGGEKMYIAEQIGNIRVYAPGRDGLFLNIAEEVTETKQPLKTDPTTPPSIKK